MFIAESKAERILVYNNDIRLKHNIVPFKITRKKPFGILQIVQFPFWIQYNLAHFLIINIGYEWRWCLIYYCWWTLERVSQTQVLGTQRKINMCLRQEVAQTNLKFHSDWNIILFIWFFCQISVLSEWEVKLLNQIYFLHVLSMLCKIQWSSFLM